MPTDSRKKNSLLYLIPLALAIVCALAFAFWLSLDTPYPETKRVPVVYETPESGNSAGGLNTGTLIPGSAAASAHPGSWPQFRGALRDNIAPPSERLARSWPETGPEVLWRIPVGEGHAGVAIHNGRVYLDDYDREASEVAIRCLSFDSGEEIWRYTYSLDVKRNHGMSRTVPAVTDDFVVALGPKCHVVCLNAVTGEKVWQKDLVKEFGTVVPDWYAGQCPLIDGDKAILAPGAKPLMMAVDLATGNTVWTTEEADGLEMTHTSIAPMELNGIRQYVYSARFGVASVAADSGAVLWTYPDWRIKIAAIASPLPIEGDRIFFSGGYGAGSAMAQVTSAEGVFTIEEQYRLKPRDFGAEQQTPIYYKGHIYGVIPSGELACLSTDGKVLWAYKPPTKKGFGLGPYLIADGLILVLNDQNGTLHLAEASPDGYNELGKAKLLDGHDAWGPMALAGGRLVLRDLTEMICVDIGG